jgi:hypothetical protein
VLARKKTAATNSKTLAITPEDRTPIAKQIQALHASFVARVQLTNERKCAILLSVNGVLLPSSEFFGCESAETPSRFS